MGRYQYKWLLFNGSDWDVVQNWSDRDTFTWTPAFANVRYRVSVWVRSVGNTRDECEASTEAAFAIGGLRRPTSLMTRTAATRIRSLASPVSTVMLNADRSSPQPVGAPITLTAAASGGGTGRQYQWFVYDGRQWARVASWSASDTFVWIPLSPNDRWRICVWARGAESTSDYFDACSEIEFAIRAD